MDRVMRKQLERAARVMGFCRDNAADLDGFQSAISRFEETMGRATAAAHGELTARLAVREAVAERNGLAAVIHADLRLLARLARTAGEQALGTPIVIRHPGPKQNQVQFLNGARVAVETGRERQELLGQYELPAGHLDRISAQLDTFAEWITRRDAAARAHIAARRRMQHLAKELTLVLDQLHALIAHRFRAEPASLGAWSSASGIRLRRRKSAELASPVPAQAALPPGSTQGAVSS